MVSDLRNQDQVERFLRNANAEELLERRRQIQSLLCQSPSPFADAEHLIARIAYELRFRIPQPV